MAGRSPSPSLPDAGLLAASPFADRALGEQLRSPKPLVVAVSGGADSVALLHSLSRIRRHRNGDSALKTLSVAHLNHGLRGAESDGDARFVATLCKELGVRFIGESADIQAEANRTGESLEMAARRVRMDFLDHVAEEQHAEFVATGHTFDDQLELFLLRLVRGASLSGLSGMEKVQRRVDGGIGRLRPFLALRHSRLVEFLSGEGLAWREDSTNAEDGALRNKMRHHVVPALCSIAGNSFPRTFARTQELLRDDNRLLDSLAESLGGDRSQRPLTRRRIVKAMHCAQIPAHRVRSDTVEKICDALEQGSSAKFDLGSGNIAEVVNHSIRVGKAQTVASPWTSPVFCISSGDDSQTDWHVVPEDIQGLRFSTSSKPERPRRSSPLARPACATFSLYALVNRRLRFRTLQAGDRLRLPGSPGSRLISDILTDAKIPKRDRAATSVLADADSGNVLWLPGFGPDESVADSPGSTIAKLELQ